MSSGDESKHSKVHVSTGLIRAISHLKTHKATRGRGGKRRWRGRQWRRGRRTYIEISCTVKTILIGHHTERETDNTGERGEERQRVEKGAVVGRQNKQNKTKGKKNGVMRHHVGSAENNKQEWRLRGKRWENGAKQIVRERREKEGWDYYTPCNMQDKNTTSLYANASKWYYCFFSCLLNIKKLLNVAIITILELQGNGISAQPTININSQ